MQGGEQEKMDSNKVLIGFCVALVVAFLAFPIVASKVRAQNSAATSSTSGGGAQTAGDPKTANPELNQPPLLNEGNLIGSEWQVQVDQYKIKVTLAAGGIAYATHPMAKAMTGMDYIEGRWRLQYDKIFINASLGGNEYAIELRISGSKVFAVNKKGGLSEVKRF